MPRQPQIHIRLKPPDHNGNCSIYIQFIYNGYRLFYSFGQLIKKDDWSYAKQRVKKKDVTLIDSKFELNELLDNLQRLLLKAYNEQLKDGIPPPHVLKKALKDFMNQRRPTLVNADFYALADRFVSGEIKHKGKAKCKQTLKNYLSVVNHLKAFEIKYKYAITFEAITLNFFYQYTSFLTDELKLGVNTIAKDITTIKLFMREASDLGLTENLQFKNKKFAYSEQETDHVYLTEQELHFLYKQKITNKKLEQVRDLFIFAAWSGLRYSDFSNIQPENLVLDEGDYYIKLISKKTKESVMIPANPVIVEIFSKYKENVNKLPKAISNQKFNEYIKDVCKMAGMTQRGRLLANPDSKLYQLVSSHTARRSFATNYYLQGFPTIDLMKITGHRSEKSFLKYIRVSKLDTAKRLSQHIKRNWISVETT